MSEDKQLEEFSEKVSNFYKTDNTHLMINQFVISLCMSLFQYTEYNAYANIFSNPLFVEKFNNKMLDTIESFLSADEFKKNFKEIECSQRDMYFKNLKNYIENFSKCNPNFPCYINSQVLLSLLKEKYGD